MALFPPPTPWKAFREPRPEHEYLVVLTRLPVRPLTALPTFFRHVRRIREQLEGAPHGLAGYSLLAQVFSSNYWTLSAWESPAALGGFITQNPHKDTMEQLPHILSGFRTWKWKTAGNDLPPTWPAALDHARPAAS